MSGGAAITVRGLGKQYRLGDAPAADSLREALAGLFSRTTVVKTAAAFQRNRNGDDDARTIWSLRDVSFDVGHGTTLAIIGRNGAGKSTLLKILSRITQPTTGRVQIAGRVGSLLEVGSGFHPDLTGRENIYLNGAILGMRRREIDAKFDEIVAFAEVERFLDTQVKHYSSGMYMRLAFSVAAHLEPDILLVDEVLAVGDLDFQRKCIGKMASVAGEGRTVLFVSHNLVAVRALCRSAIVLDNGRVVQQGDTGDCIAYYVSSGILEDASTWTRPERAPDVPVALARVESRVVGQQPNLTLELDVIVESRTRHRPAFLAIDILDAAGVAIMQAIPSLDGFIPDDTARHRVHVSISLPPLIPASYFATVWVGTRFVDEGDLADRGIRFEVHDSPTAGRPYPHTTDHGYIVPPSVATCEAV